MASLLRQIVAGPRARHPEAGLDLCYVTDQIIVTSGPSSTYPQLAYRNPLSDLVKFLDSKHKDKWSIWEFRAEGTGYPDEEVYNRILHYPFPDHHPPPFALIPNIMASMRNWLKEEEGRVVVVHCKAGKGRSGSMTCSYLISECGWTASDALARFTERRMRPGFGQGVSIPSQLRWVDYVTRWTKNGKTYVERQVEIVEIHVWGIRDGVKVAVEGFVEDGRVIKNFRIFDKDERTIVENIRKSNGKLAAAAGSSNEAKFSKTDLKDKIFQAGLGQPGKNTSANHEAQASTISPDAKPLDQGEGDEAGEAVIFKPREALILPSNDVNIDFERRNKATYGWSMVTSVAHVWFNAFFEGNGPENGGKPAKSGVFEIEWDKMDGIKGSSRKGTRALDRVSVIWKIYEGAEAKVEIINEPAEGEEVKQMKPADWKGEAVESDSLGKDLGLRSDTPADANVSKASSVHSGDDVDNKEDQPDLTDTKVRGLDGEDYIVVPKGESGTASPSTPSSEMSAGGHASQVPTPTVSSMGQTSTGDLPGGVPENEMKTAHQNVLGSLGYHKQ